ncbi:MAG: hypothetical protein RL030_1242 [Pseudomonadota bacterium]|jgi:membrane-associated PAP2 superfamily phosphatase
MFLATIAALDFWHLDTAIATRWAFDAAQGQFRGHGAFWANGLMHAGGRDLVIALALAALVCALLGRFAPRRFPSLQGHSRALFGGFLGMGVTVALVGAFKHFSNVDCPWDLIDFGGTQPYVGLFAARPAGLPPASGCFPAAHAASAYALLAFYFAFRDTHPRLGRFLLPAILVLGASFGFAQQSRGAHFLSHDVWSVYIAWMTGLLSQRGWIAGDRALRTIRQRSSATFMPSRDPAQVEMRSIPER